MAAFTPTQGRYLSYIHAYTDGFGLPPAESEIAEAIGVSPPSVNQMMKTLEKKGLIERTPNTPRSTKILVDPSDIPRWKGKRITRTVTGWMPANAPRQQPVTARHGDTTAYRFKATLQGINPPIWRQFETQDVSLGALHALIQTAMGWTNSHLHQFAIGDEIYTDPRALMMGDSWGAKSYEGIKISDLVREHGESLRLGYLYDFGDSWEHAVALEKIFETKSSDVFPRCIDGDRACPPEDIGGAPGFAEFVEAIKNPKHKQHEEYLEWHGPFDPAKFLARVATRRMRDGLSSW